MVADDPVARPAPEKLAAVVEVHEVTPDGPCRALDLVGGAPPSAEQGDLGIDVSFQAREASEPTTPGDLRSLAKFWEYDMVTDKERSSLASLAAVSSQATRGTVPQRIKTLASLRESGKLSEASTRRLRAAVRVVGGESPARGASRHGDDVAAGLAAGLDDGTADGDELSCARLWCVSDLHLDCPGNEGWLGTLEPRPDDALIVAGDAAVRLDALRAALETLARLYKHVVFVPGNHELWLTNASGSLDTAAHADSVAKFFAILELCDELGVWTHAVTFNDACLVLPLFSWHAPDFVDQKITGHDRFFDAFDCQTVWPEWLGSPRVEVARDPRVAKFFLQLNKPALAYAEQRRDALEREGNRLDVVAVSHFLPLPELFRAAAPESRSATRSDDTARKARDLKPALLYSARPLYA
ncbi:calcineurin-like phosphoesterase [Aureococcus anophagefferens]|nr:calcineurin-like phosphoesterase [Aureococcus anophagefferens]